ncbi:MAG: sigma-70 family RNA polymerase sigma factor [Bryobacteraceae bacterium]|jgi:RNA polymerase sigma-70 factor (ECF subfamily)
MPDPAAQDGTERLQLAGLRFERAAMTLHDQVERLFLEAREDVYRYLLTLGLHPPLAQDATQDVFLSLYVALRKGETIHNPRAWVFRVAHNHGLNLRERQDYVLPFEPGIESCLPAPEKSPEQALIEQERMARLHHAIEGLSAQQKSCLYLRAEGLRYQEIAQVIGVGTSTVGEFLRRAITRLRRASHD